MVTESRQYSIINKRALDAAPKSRFKIISLITILLFFAVFQGLLGQSLLDQGILAFNLDDYEGAVGYLTRYLEVNPYSQQAYEYLVNSYLALNLHKNALETLEKAVEIFPEKSSFYKLIGQLYAQTDQYENSRSALEKYLEMSPGDYEAQSLLSTIYYNCGLNAAGDEDYYASLDYFGRAIELDSSYMEAYKRKAAVLIEIKDYIQAQKHLVNTIDLFPNNDDFRKAYFDVLVRQEKYRQALTALEEIQRNEPENIDLGLQLGVLYRYLNENENALVLYNQLAKKHPEERKIYEAIIEYWNSFDRQDKIRQTYELMLETFPDERNIHKNIAKTYEREENWQAAREKYKELLKVNPRDSEIRLLIAATLSKENNNDKALKEINKILDYDENNYDALKELGRIYDEDGSGESLSLYKSMYEYYPDDFYAAYHLGMAFMKNGPLDSAEAYLQTAKKLASHQPLSNLALGQIKEIKGDTKQAIDLHRQALNLAIKKIADLRYQLETIPVSAEGRVKMNYLPGYEVLQSQFMETEYLIEECMSFLKRKYTYNDYGAMLNAYLRQYPSSISLHLYQGRWYEDSGNTKQAKLSYKKTLSLNPRIIQAHERLGAIYEGEGEYEQALSSYRNMLDIENSNEGAYDGLIRIHEKLNNLDDLCDEWLALYMQYPNYEILRDKLAEVLHKAKRFDEAKAIIESKMK